MHGETVSVYFITDYISDEGFSCITGGSCSMSDVILKFVIQNYKIH